jgi:hypothetical protein
MSFSIGPQTWLEVLQREYLDSFVLDGGSAIKFAVPLDDAASAHVGERLGRAAEERGYLVVRISAASSRVHMIEQVFFRIAEQVPWQHLSQRVIAKLAAEEGYAAASETDGPLFRRIADENRVEPEFLLMELRRKLATEVLQQPTMAKDFRVAMTQLCRAELTGGAEGITTTQVLTDWLTGRNKAVAAVKPYQIFTRVNRTNARYLLESLLHWVRFAGYPGMVILLDIARVTLARNPRDERLYYSKAAVLDTYEVLRQFIDGTDLLQGCLVVVVPDRAFLDEDPFGRGIGAYEALKFRVFDEVRDESLVNPMASLVRLESTAAGGYR